MSGAAAARTAADASGGRRRGGAVDLWICWWVLPVFYVLFGLIFVLLARVIPPPRPDRSPEEVAAFFHDHAATIRIGFAALMVVIGFTGVANGLVAHQMKRMAVSPVFAYAYIAALAVGALPGCLMAAFCFLAAVFRPGRDPHVLALLYDIGLLTFVGSLGCFTTQYLVLALAILLDRRRIFPTWMAYVCVWQIVTELLAAPVFVFKDGPLAWDGSISFYMGTVIFGIYEVCIIVLLFKAVRDQPPGEPVQD
ncbi:hypothetical protein [Actinomadura parmotrematis]|uniref:DUF4386 domain-containing protein n=1 Tax=Actinomadura parmotrematis TaxID=2864039 RepID=A0ABS7FQJ8_9ACTN|nr:hypothetical protein [Actinomadura parmotrematis]MBW8482662.1 hypothetical protein [Actinomadura parmotrematis]